MACARTLLVALATFAVAVFLLNGEVSIAETTPKAILGDLRYDYGGLVAPVASGWALTLQSYVLTQSLLGPVLRRVLLNSNGLSVLRELAAQAPALPPMHFPMRRLSKEAWDRHSNAAAKGKESLDGALVSTGGGEDGDAAAADALFGGSRAMEFRRAFLSGSITPTQVAERTLQALLGDNFSSVGGGVGGVGQEGGDDQEVGLQAKYRVFASLDSSRVLKQAAESTQRYKAGTSVGVLDGVPVAVKDMIEVEGYKMRDGSSANEHREHASNNDPVVERLRTLGAVVLGTTSMTEGGVTPLGYCVAEKGPFNVFDTSFYSGGSSSGSAVAVGLGLVPFAIGFDSGGSIRIPASFNGAVGLATTFGRVGFESRTGSTMIKAGPIASSVSDAALGYAAMGSADANHFYGSAHMYGGSEGVPPLHLDELPPPSSVVVCAAAAAAAAAGGSLPLAGVRVGVFWDHFNDSTPLVRDACQAAVSRLESMGAVVVEVALPNIGWFRLAHAIKISTEFALAWDGAYHDSVRGSLLEPNTRITAGLGSSVTALESLSAERLRRWLFEYVTEELFQKHNLDCLATPTLPMVAPEMPTNADALLTGESNVPLVIEMMKYIFLANFLGLPAITLPVPPSPSSSSLSPEVSSDDDDDTKLPIGFQLTGDHWSEAKLLRIASTLEGSFKAKKDGSKDSLGKTELASSTCNTSDGDAPRPPDYFDALKS